MGISLAPADSLCLTNHLQLFCTAPAPPLELGGDSFAEGRDIASWHFLAYVPQPSPHLAGIWKNIIISFLLEMCSFALPFCRIFWQGMSGKAASKARG